MSLYDKHFKTLVKDVSPRDDLKTLVNIFMKDAGINMGNDFSDETLERVIEMIQNNFELLPIYIVASAFKKGSLGNYGAGRLVPRTIYSWLNEISLEYQRDKEGKELDARLNSKSIPVDLHKYPMGTALNLKIDWLTSGAIDSDGWDKIDLKELAELIGKGVQPSPEYFRL